MTRSGVMLWQGLRVSMLSLWLGQKVWKDYRLVCGLDQGVSLQGFKQ